MAAHVPESGVGGPQRERTARQEVLARLWADMARAVPGDRPLVLGEGSPVSPLALVGEAPGREEERKGRPFAGPAGHILDTMLQEVGIPREDVWITNAVKRRPVVVRGGREQNRAPTAVELRAGAVWLHRELEVVRPRLIVCLGAVAARGVLGRGVRLGDERGRWQDGPLGSLVLLTYHPAYVLRLQGTPYRQAFEEALRQYREDFQQVREAYQQTMAA